MTTPQRSPAEFFAALDQTSTRRTTPVGVGDLVWRIWGSGDPLLLLHGGTGSWMHWMRNIEELSRDFMLLVPDIPGSGESAAPTMPTSVEAVAQALLNGIDAILGPRRPFSIAAFSMGGLVSGYVAKLAGARVQCLVLVGAVGTTAPRAPMVEPLVSWRRLPTDAERRAAHRKNLELLMVRDPANIDDLALYMQAHNAERSRVRGKHVNPTGNLPQALVHYKGRLASIWGEHDVTAVPYFAERRAKLEEVRADATFDIIPGVGHWVQFEAPAEFNRLLRMRLKP